jgi:hypothetical protein
MGVVTLFCALTTTGAGELVLHSVGEIRSAVDCKLNAV